MEHIISQQKCLDAKEAKQMIFQPQSKLHRAKLNMSGVFARLSAFN
jgi:hypothetical protein